MPPRDRPGVSIIIPVYNGEKYLAEAIRSVMAQGVEPLELIIIDDGSADRTREIAGAFGPNCRYHYQENAGPAAARNTGLEMARHEIIGFLDADDLFPPNALAVRYSRLLESNDLDAVMGTAQVLEPHYAVTAPPQPLKRHNADTSPPQPLERPNAVMGPPQAPECHNADKSPAQPLKRHNADMCGFQPKDNPVICYHLATLLARRAVFENVGGFNPGYRYCEDVDWFMRAQEQGTKFEVLAEAVLWYRRHDANMTRDGAALASGLTKVLKASLERRRKLASNVPLDEIYPIRPGRLRI